MEKGKSLLEAGDIESAIERFESSLGIHSKFDKDKSRECDSLFKQTIESYMQFGNSLFDNGDFENAEEIFENSKDYIDDHLDLLYDANIVTSSILNEYEKIWDEADSKIEKCSIGLDVMKTYEQAIRFYDSGYYDEAKPRFEKAKEVFESIDSKGMYENASDYILKCDLVKEARTLLEKGKSQFVSEDYESAKGSLEKAKEMFQEIGMFEKVTECDEWLQKIEEQEEPEEEEKEEAGIGILVVLFGLILIIGFLRRRLANDS